MQRPNILWISFEDTSPRFGCYGDEIARTPNVDRLAAEGCVYSNAFSTAGVCAPSRFAIITGCYATSMGAHHMRTTHDNRATPELPTPYCTRVPHTVRCFTEYFRKAGYYCSNNSKTDYQFRPPASAWDDSSEQAHWRNRESKDQPFFSVFNPTRTHESGQWPEKQQGDLVTDPDDVDVPPFVPNTRRTREAIARQYDHIAENDKLVGRLLEELEEDGELENTIVIIWSDHGEGLPRAKRWLYDSGIRVPLIVRWPGNIEAGSHNDQIVSMIDLGPTMLSCCGLSVPSVMQGQPFMGPAKIERRYVHAARDRFDESYDMVRAVRDDRFKYIQNHRPELPYLLWIPYRNKHPIYQDIWELYRRDQLTGPLSWYAQTERPVEELYDLEADPYECNNLAADPAYAEDLARLRQEHDDWRQHYGDYGDMDEVTMVHQWYPDGKKDTCATPIFVPLAEGWTGTESICGDQPGEPSDGQIQLQGPSILTLHCATQGAALIYQRSDDLEKRWRYYVGPIRLPNNQSVVITAKATRIGYEPSEETQLIVMTRSS